MSYSIKKIAESINIGIDTIAFVDDQIFELEEVKFEHPEVLCINAKNIRFTGNAPDEPQIYY